MAVHISYAQVPTTATPSYYYDRESAFLLNYAIDPANGGIYLAVNESGAIVDLSGVNVWNGVAPPGTLSSSKTPTAQAIAMLYFIREYHRTKEKGVSGINALVTNPARQLTAPLDLLTTWAKNIADFSVTGSKFKITAAGQTALGTNANKLYYWGRTKADGTGGTPDGIGGAATPESIVPWALAELALTMKDAGVSPTIYQPYIDEAVNWWVWRKTTAVYVGYGYGQNGNYGAGRDVYYGALGLTLNELTGLGEYKSGPGTMSDGSRLGALPYMHNALGSAGTNPNLGNPPAFAVQDGAYVAGFGRAITFGKLEQRAALGFTATFGERQPFQEFGFSPLYERGNSYPVYDINSPAELISLGEDPTVAFQHFKGRELFASVLRSSWHFYSFGVNGGMFYANNGSNPNWPTDFTASTLKTTAKAYWDYCNSTFWDNTSGVAAWLENSGTPRYKPCFSGGVDVPIADWQSPDIGTCTHVWTAGSTAVISVTGVIDNDWQYLTYKLDNSGIAGVEIVYTADNGATWSTVTATLSSGSTYTATIPALAIATAHANGFNFYYYARARDTYGNYETCPAGAQDILPETGIKTAAGVETAQFTALSNVIPNPTPPCLLTATATVGVCNMLTNQYAVSGSLSLTSNTTGGTATIADGTASTTVTIASSTTSAAYSLTGLISDGNSHTLVVSLPTCGSASIVYTAPSSCIVAVPAYNLSKTVDQSRVEKGGIVTYTVSLTNAGTTTGTNLVIADQFSTTAVTFLSSATASVGTFIPASNSGSWLIPTLPSGQVATLAFQVQMTDEGVTYNTATAPDGTSATACLTVPIHVCDNAPFAFELSAPASYSAYQWSLNGVPVASATSSTFNATAIGEYTVTTSAAPCPDGSCCPVVIVADPAPSLTAVGVAATCTGATPLSDARLTLVGSSTAAVSYNVSPGSSFTASAPLFASAQPLSGLVSGAVLLGQQANPASAPGSSYTIRVYSATGCFSDTVVVIPPAQCTCPPDKCAPLVVKKLVIRR
ncbi:hypothetical protein [uncultured Fibrella sp.]|uniref:hypothetical protein n=1 Tax=uncultured Fibrella sp. TaxID=1284596 RepID=UPI0035CB01F4